MSKPFPCPDCSRGFKSDEALLAHRIDKHGAPHPFWCEDCGINLRAKRNLELHLKQVHPEPPPCIECGSTAVLVTGEAIYPHRPDLYSRHFYRCRCGAYCGCHRGTVQPLGFPCGPETRRARMKAHDAFDPLWRKGAMNRYSAYAWLAKATGIPFERCHIGMMSADEARLVVEVVREKKRAESEVA